MAGPSRFERRRSASNAAWASGGVYVDASEVNQLAADLRDLPARKVRQIAPLVAATGLRTVADAKTAAPVDTGFLRSTIGMTVDPDGLGMEAGPTAAYGGYVEHGTSRMAPQPFMGPSFDRQLPGFEQGLAQIAGEGL